MGLTTIECQSGMDPRMGIKPRVWKRQLGMRIAPQEEPALVRAMQHHATLHRVTIMDAVRNGLSKT